MPQPADPASRFEGTTAKFWAFTAGFILLGYLCMGRSFAYLGIKPLNLFIGEMVLGLFLVTKSREIVGRWLGSMVNEVSFSQTAWIYYLFASYGVIELLRGLTYDYPVFTALQNLVFNVYPLYLFIGLWLGIRYPNYLQRFVRWLAWGHGVYGVLYIAVLNPLSWNEAVMAGEDVPLFGQPGGSPIAILGLLCFESKFQRMAIPLLLNAFVLLGIQVRAEWLGFGLGFLIWGLLSRKVGGMLAGAGAIAVLLAVGYVADFSIPGPAGRGGTISTRDIIGRGLSAFDAESASKYTDSADSTAGTVEWRKKWWEAIWNSVHETNLRTLFGHGYGFPITDLVTYLSSEDTLRSPHNIFFFCLGYGGWIGVILFFTFQLALLRLHWLTYQVTKIPFGIVFLPTCIAVAFFSNFFETPFGAIPYYLITGLAISPLLATQQR